jgi:ATP-dependent Zn protease
MSKDELKRIARHEAGHVLMSYLLKYMRWGSVTKNQQITNYILSHICVLLGGISAEMIYYKELSSGGHDDIEKVTSLIQHYYKD